MIDRETLIAYLEDTLDASSRAEVENQLAGDEEALRFVAEQRKIDRVLRSMLRRVEHKQRVKQSILSAVRGTSAEQLKAQVLEHTVARPSVRSRTVWWGLASIARRLLRRTGGAAAPPAGELEPAHSLGYGLLRRLASSPTRGFAFGATALLVVFVLGGAFLVHKGQVERIPIGKFAVVMGIPKVQPSGERSAHYPQLATPVFLGDRLETGDADKAEIQFKDGTTLRVNFNTTIEIPNPKSQIRNPKSKLSRSNSSPLQRPPEIRLLLGQIWTKVQKSTNAPPFAIHTPVASASVRGTEFGLKLQRGSTNTTAQSPIGNLHSETPLLAVLTVKEGAVDFFNSLGSVQATAMTESTAHAGARPTEPKRLQTLQVVRLTDSKEWFLMTSPLSWPEAAEKLALGGGWVGLRVRDFPSGTLATHAITDAATGEVRVVQVTRQSPADSAGLQPGDILLAINGQPVTTAIQIERAILIRPNAETTLNLRRGGEKRTVALTVTNRASILPGPILSPALNARLSSATRQFVEGNVRPVTPTFQSARLPVENRRYNNALRISESGPLRAAAQNNLGVVYEIDDAMGPAIRAYGLAVYVDPQVPLYHFNLGLALRKIGSFERAAEELETALRLAPQSTRARQRFAEIQSLLRHDDEALAITDAALQADPQSHGLWELKAQLLLKAQRLEESRQAALKAIELEPDCAVAQGYFAAVLHQTSVKAPFWLEKRRRSNSRKGDQMGGNAARAFRASDGRVDPGPLIWKRLPPASSSSGSINAIPCSRSIKIARRSSCMSTTALNFWRSCPIGPRPPR